jgi:hypothetical protein
MNINRPEISVAEIDAAKEFLYSITQIREVEEAPVEGLTYGQLVRLLAWYAEYTKACEANG